MIHRVGASVRGRAVAEKAAGPVQHHIVSWPGEPVRARKPKEGTRP
jgi:hypothetical protein